MARGHCQNYFENVDMIGNSLGFLFKRLVLLNSFVTHSLDLDLNDQKTRHNF